MGNWDWSVTLVLLFIGGLLFAIDGLFSTISGWRRLASRFRASETPSGPRIRRQVVKMGSVPEAGVTHMVPSAQGLYLWAGPRYRLFRPPLLIPWTAVSTIGDHRTLCWKRYDLNLADVTTIRISQRAYEILRQFLPAGRALPPNPALHRTGARDVRSGR